MEIKNLKGYHKNPRKITEKMFNLLGDSIKEFGDLSGIVFNVRSQEIIGGNQRTQFFKKNDKDVEIHTTPVTASKVGTVAQGYVIFQGEKYNYREVDWDEKKSERANLNANKMGGFFDQDMLANQFDIEDLKLAGFEDFELGMFESEIKVDKSDLEQTMDSYLEGNIKQIVLFFTAEEFENVMPRMEALMKELNVQNHTEAFLKILEEHEKKNEGNKTS